MRIEAGACHSEAARPRTAIREQNGRGPGPRQAQFGECRRPEINGLGLPAAEQLNQKSLAKDNLADAPGQNIF